MDYSDSYGRYMIALIFVIVLILVAAGVARHFGLGGGGLRLGGRRVRRLGIVEVLPVDSRRRLILVRRDATEHLLLVGGSADVVVETVAARGFAETLRAVVPGPGARSAAGHPPFAAGAIGDDPGTGREEGGPS